MMNSMRKHTKVVLWIVVGAFLSTIFFVWGMDAGKRQEFTEKQSAAMVNGEAISYEAFGRLWEQRYRQLFKNTDEEPSPQEMQTLREDLIDQMIEQSLTKQLFNQYQLEVYPQEIAARIASIPAFQENRQFSQQKYLSMLQYNQVTPAEFEAEQKVAIAAIKINQVLQNSVLVTDEDLKDYFAARNRKIQLAVVAFDWKDEAKHIIISEKDAKDYFESNQSRYETPEEVKASHILIKVNADASTEDKAAAKLKLEDIRNQIIDGQSFDKLAKEHSDDPGSKDKGGDLGYFRRGMMVPPFETAAFSLNKGELSDIVETDFGFHIIKVLDKKEAKKSSFASVQQDIINELKEDKAKQAVQKKALAFAKVLKQSKDLLAAATTEKLAPQVTKWLQEGNQIDNITKNDTIVNKALDLSLNQPSQPLFDDQNIIFVQVTKEQYLPFNETVFKLEKDDLLKKLKSIRGEQALQSWIAQAKKDATIINNIAKEGQSLEKEVEPSTPEQPGSN